MAEDLPDTQTQTQTQDSQLEWTQNTPVISIVWGRLYTKRDTEILDMTTPQFTVGRALTCDYVLKNSNLPDKLLFKNVSKEHFLISRDTSEVFSPVYLYDLSCNGTYVNETKVGKGNKRILDSKDKIAIAHPKAMLFVFFDPLINEVDQKIPMGISQKYFISRKLGVGACGVVKLIYNKVTCAKYALKIISKKIQGQINPLNDPSKIMNEVNILKALKHPFIISTVEVVDTQETLCIVLELMSGGELFDRVFKCGRLTEKCAKIIFRQMILAVKYLHEQGIAHRDLKPENVLLASDDGEPLIKITDFGLSKLVGEESFMKTMCGTPLYVAPEVLLAKGKNMYGPQVDIWSLGVILFICLSGYLPFSQEYKGKSLEEQIMKGQYFMSRKHWEGVSKDARLLVSRMLDIDPKRRITLEDILIDKWMMDDEVIQTVNRFMQMGADNSTDNLDSTVVTENNNSTIIKRALSETAKQDDPPPKRRKLQAVAESSPFVSSSDDTVEELSVESLSFKS